MKLKEFSLIVIVLLLKITIRSFTLTNPEIFISVIWEMKNPGIFLLSLIKRKMAIAFILPIMTA